MSEMKNRSQALRDSIEEMIAVGELKPGQHLDETELATRFGVSRTPIREALLQLSSMGVIAIRPRRGAVVAEISPQGLLEMFEVMAELEAMCGRLAARRMLPEELARLQALHRECEAARDANDADGYYNCNELFHQMIYEGSHNVFLAEQARNLQRRLRPYRRLQLRVRDRLANSFSEHEGIVEGLQAGDSEQTANRLRAHVTVQGQRFADLIASLQHLKDKAA